MQIIRNPLPTYRRRTGRWRVPDSCRDSIWGKARYIIARINRLVPVRLCRLATLFLPCLAHLHLHCHLISLDIPHLESFLVHKLWILKNYTCFSFVWFRGLHVHRFCRELLFQKPADSWCVFRRVGSTLRQRLLRPLLCKPARRGIREAWHWRHKSLTRSFSKPLLVTGAPRPRNQHRALPQHLNHQNRILFLMHIFINSFNPWTAGTDYIHF